MCQKSILAALVSIFLITIDCPRAENKELLNPELNTRLSMRLDWKDVAWFSGAVAIQLPAQILFRNMTTTDSSQLNRQDLLPFDRFVAGTYSPRAAFTSDLIVIPFCALPTALATWDGWKEGQGIKPGFVDAVVFAEALAFSSALALMVRSLQIHPRPLVYGTEAPEENRTAREASGSFFSGHTNAAFLAATYLAYTYPIRHPEFNHEGWLWAGSLAVASSVAGLRVVAGKHFPSDVIVGAFAGSLFGWAFAIMHLQPENNSGMSLHMTLDELGYHPQISFKF